MIHILLFTEVEMSSIRLHIFHVSTNRYRCHQKAVCSRHVCMYVWYVAITYSIDRQRATFICLQQQQQKTVWTETEWPSTYVGDSVWTLACDFLYTSHMPYICKHRQGLGCISFKHCSYHFTLTHTYWELCLVHVQCSPHLKQTWTLKLHAENQQEVMWHVKLKPLHAREWKPAVDLRSPPLQQWSWGGKCLG